MKLLPKQYFIFVDSHPELGVESFYVKISDNLKALLRNWGATSRISPVWQLRSNDKGPTSPKTELTDAIALWFLSGKSPDFLRDNLLHKDLEKLESYSMWLSLGTHNIILVCRDEELDENIENLCSKHEIPHERWSVSSSDGVLEFSGNTVDYVDPKQFGSKGGKKETELSSEAFAKASIEADDALGFMQLELYALLSVVESRAIGPYSVLAHDSMRIENLANDLIASDEEDEVEPDTAEGYVDATNGNEGISRPDILLTLNAGLSRLSSQALSGTSPILRTECHFWPHSFLGIGVANLALRNVSEFITNLIQTTNYHQRIDTLRDQAFDISSYKVVKPAAGFPDFACLDPVQIVATKNADKLRKDSLVEQDDVDSETPNPITYFSGRDGFMNGVLTTSAPLPSVSGANSYQWNLGTITHEISHRILSGDLVEIFKDFLGDMYDLQQSNGDDWRKTQQYFLDCPTTYGGYASKMLGRTVWLMHCLDFDEAQMVSAMRRPYDFFVEAYNKHSAEVEELLVHIFDYYHFYGESPKNYCDYIWLSWAVQPSIEEKLREYVLRTLAALGVRHVSRSNWKELALGDFEAVLAEEPLVSRLKFLKDVKTLLSDRGKLAEIFSDLDIARHIIFVFHTLFKLEDLQSKASREKNRSPITRYRKHGAEKRKYNYKNAPFIFVSENPAIARPNFSNPLMFLRDFSREEKPNAAQSAWLLHMLAFNIDQTGDKP